ncbi:GAP family protein [Streptomyces sp. NPDC055898]
MAIILILATPQGRPNGTLFLVGRILGLALLGAIMLTVGGSGGASTNKHPATWVGILKLVLGELLVLFAARQWRRRPADPAEAQLPKWMAAIDRFTPPRVLGLGLLLSAANAKNAPPDHCRGRLDQRSRNLRSATDRGTRRLRVHRLTRSHRTADRPFVHG